jgi:hypothetical protein
VNLNRIGVLLFRESLGNGWQGSLVDFWAQTFQQSLGLSVTQLELDSRRKCVA